MKRTQLYSPLIILLLLVAFCGCQEKEMASPEDINALRNAYYAQFDELKAVKAILDEKGYADDPIHEAAYSGAVGDLNNIFMKLPEWMDEVTKEELEEYYTQLDSIIEAIEGMKAEAEATVPAE